MTMAQFGLAAEDVSILESPKAYYRQLKQLITESSSRIYISALYLQDDEVGREILHLLYQQKQQHPQMDVSVFIDDHRAQRGLIGEKESLGNRELYQEVAKQYQEPINIFGIRVKRKELLGVLHLKGMIFDDVVLYTGASINNVYLHHGDRYRLDRYYVIKHSGLADSLCNYLANTFINTGCANNLSSDELMTLPQQKRLSKTTLKAIKRNQYQVANEAANELAITPIVGCGKRRNALNVTCTQLIKQSTDTITIITPYFNLPGPILRALRRAMKRGVKVTLVVGDKCANDFFIPEDKPFTTIGIVPYIYEQILRRFLVKKRHFIERGLLTIKLWQDKGNSYHAKGLIVDEKYHLVTGSNLNPRAWGLDIENGLLITDENKLLWPRVEEELAGIVEHAHQVTDYQQLPAITDYPEKPSKLLRRLSMSKIDRVLQRFL